MRGEILASYNPTDIIGGERGTVENGLKGIKKINSRFRWELILAEFKRTANRVGKKANPHYMKTF
jgi:hypothetical protein